MHSLLLYFKRRRGLIKHNVQQGLVQSIAKLGVLLAIVFVLHIAAMMYFESLSLGDAAWLTLTTATTVGYGDISASTTEGRLATVFLLYVIGIFILAKVVGDYFDYRLAVRDKKIKGHWSWDMDEHIVIINSPTNSGERYLQRLITQFRTSERYCDTPIYLLTRQFPHGLPDFITQFDNVVHFTGNPNNPQELASVCITSARIVIVLVKDENNESADGRTFDILHRLNDLKVGATILAECVEDSNRKRLEGAGADIVIRPIRAYPEMIVRAFDAPGSERIIENMFNSEDDGYRRYDVSIQNLSWRDVVTRLINHDVGIAVAYIDGVSNEMVYNPPANSVPDIQALITISKETNKHSTEDVKALVSSSAGA